MKLYYVLSDVHGRDISLKLFEQKGFDVNNEDHILILNGDYFDRYNKNDDVLRFCELMIETLKDRFILIKGNHDEFFMDFIQELEAYDVGDVLNEENFNLERWLRNGGRVTIEQLFGDINGIYSQSKVDKKNRLTKFSAHIRDYYETPSYIFTHASIDAKKHVDVWDREFFHSGFKSNKTVIIGHTTYYNLKNHKIIEASFKGHPFTYAVSKSRTQCPVYDIDNGEGSNIAIFFES